SLAQPNHDEVAAALHRVNRDATLAAGVIARIRKFLRAGEIKRERIAVPRLLDELLLMLQTLLLDAGVEVELSLPDDLPELLADAVQLQQVILNLIVNAVDAMREQRGSTHSLRIEVREDAAAGMLFAVQDDGPGVPAAGRDKLFDAFFSTKQDGLGMGLAISRTIVENHGGRLWLDETVPAGARFVFNIPAA
ncbi:MAG: GHKL domain-containing protein, partial [Proteobacteria bacterium]|nr:GHKL domain-containing protein [Pseudomonadota bacterium]